MSIKLDWGDYDKNFAIMNIHGRWSGDELVNAIGQLSVMGYEAHNGMELLVDVRNSLTPPNNLLTLLRSILNRPLPPNIKQVVVISSSAFWNRIFSMLNSMYGDKITCPVTFVASVDDGYSALDFFKDVV